jgi:site-specific DNA recombinase
VIPSIATYCRVALNSPGCPTVAASSQQMIKLLQARYPSSLIASYIDEGRSTNHQARPRLRAMLADAEQGRFDLIVVPALSDLSRSIHDLGAILRRLHDAGVELQTLDSIIDTSATSGRFLIQLTMAMADHEGTTERIRRRRQSAGSPDQSRRS